MNPALQLPWALTNAVCLCLLCSSLVIKEQIPNTVRCLPGHEKRLQVFLHGAFWFHLLRSRVWAARRKWQKSMVFSLLFSGDPLGSSVVQQEPLRGSQHGLVATQLSVNSILLLSFIYWDLGMILFNLKKNSTVKHRKQQQTITTLEITSIKKNSKGPAFFFSKIFHSKCSLLL